MDFRKTMASAAALALAFAPGAALSGLPSGEDDSKSNVTSVEQVQIIAADDDWNDDNDEWEEDDEFDLSDWDDDDDDFEEDDEWDAADGDDDDDFEEDDTEEDW